MSKTEIYKGIARKCDELADLFRLLAAPDEFQSPTLRNEAQAEARQASEDPAREPLARSLTDLVTPRQLGMIRALARAAGVEVEAECRSLLRCGTEELSKRAASGLIDHLKNIQAESDVTRARRA